MTLPAALLPLAFLAAAAAPPAAPAPAPAPPRVSEVRMTLREVLARAVERYPELEVVAAERDGALALQSLAHWTRWTPKFTDTTVFGVVPAARGNILFSPDDPRDLDDLGFFYRTRVDLSLPIFTFGRLAGAERAAKTLVASKDAKGEAKRDAARVLAARAYFGYLLAANGIDVLHDIRRHLDQLLDQLEHPAEGDPEPGPLDPLKARRYGFELDRQEAGVERQLALATAGLGELLAVRPPEVVRPAATDLVALSAAPPDLEPAIAEALAKSPELKEIELAALARDLWAQVTKKDSLPALSLEGRFEYGEARNRDPQDNPFVYDAFNVKTLTAGFALRWELNFLQTGARARKDLAEAAELRAKRDALVARTRYAVAETHGKLVEAIKVHESARRALSTGATWLRIAEENYGLETASLNDVIDAYKAYVETRSDHLAAVHDLNLTLVLWRLALGREPLEEGEAP